MESTMRYGKLHKLWFRKIYLTKRCQRGNFDKNTKPREPWPSQTFLKQKKRPQDIAIDNILEKVQDKVLEIMGPLSKLPIVVDQVTM